jgi:hypothetical protein
VMGEKGHQWVRRRFSWNSIATQMIACYCELLKCAAVSRAAVTNRREP